MKTSQKKTKDGKRCCWICKEWKPLDEFYKDKNCSLGYSYICRICGLHRRRTYSMINERNKKYNITNEDFNRMLVEQNGKCKICGFQFILDVGNRLTSPAVDHCHKTNKTRGLLCNTCNRALGLFKDSLEILENAVKYLKNEDKSKGN